MLRLVLHVRIHGSQCSTCTAKLWLKSPSICPEVCQIRRNVTRNLTTPELLREGFLVAAIWSSRSVFHWWHDDTSSGLENGAAFLHFMGVACESCNLQLPRLPKAFRFAVAWALIANAAHEKGYVRIEDHAVAPWSKSPSRHTE